MAMDMMTGDQIAQAELADWRKLAQGLHARYITDGLGKAASFVQALSEASGMDRHLRVRIGPGYVDLELVSEDAIYCDDEGTKHTVEWVTAHDVELARHITGIVAEQGLRADPTAVSELELGLDTLAAADIAPVWAALLTGDANSRGRGTPSEEIRDATVRVPNLWFNEVPQHDGSQRFHVEIYVAAEAVATPRRRRRRGRDGRRRQRLIGTHRHRRPRWQPRDSVRDRAASRVGRGRRDRRVGTAYRIVPLRSRDRGGP